VTATDRRGETLDEKRTIASFAPFIAGHLTPSRRDALLAVWRAEAMLATPDCAGRCRRARARGSHSFLPRAYWRGPVWPVMNGCSACRCAAARAGRCRRAGAGSLAQVREIGFAEYVEPFTGEPLGSLVPVVTAAVTLDWLAGSA